MLERFRATTHHVMEAAIAWADPHWWIWTAITFFVLCLVHPVPLRLPEEHIYSFKAHVALWVRRAAVGAFVGVVLLFPLMLYMAFGALAQTSQRQAALLFEGWALDQAKAYWEAPVAGLGLGLMVSILWHRYLDPYLSDMLRKYRVNQGEGAPSDVKTEANNLQTKTYDPRKYYKVGNYFLGLDESGQPIYCTDAEFHQTHTMIIGPTGTGKGSEYQILIDQACDKGVCTFFVDPKEDDNVLQVMAQGAARNKRPFVFLDLNPGGQGNWHPFKGGSDRDRRSRVVSAFKLAAAGSDADVYKSAERKLLDKAMAKTDGSIRQLLEFIEQSSDSDKLSTLRDTLTEWASISTFTPAKKTKGHSIEQSLRNNAIVYVRGSISDDVVRLATRCYIQELLQELKRLRPERVGQQTTVYCDEVRFTISNEVVDGLATIRSTETNMVVATQAVSDLRNVKDRDLDKEALQQSFTINCKIKMLYQAGDQETALWGEELSGTTWIRQQMMEKTEVNRYGGEKWSDNRSMREVEVPLVHRNKLLMLEERVGILYRPGIPAATMFSAYLPLKERVNTWEKPKLDKSAEAGEGTDKPTHEDSEILAPEREIPGIDVHKL